jgi:hypothetical protein
MLFHLQRFDSVERKWRVIMITEKVRTWKDAVMAFFNVIS